MLTNHGFVCFSTLDWDFRWQGHQQIMATFARHGNRVLYVENLGVRPPGLRDTGRVVRRATNWVRAQVRGLRHPLPNLWVFSPLAIPLHRSSLVRRLNRAILSASLRGLTRRLDIQRPIVWISLPTQMVLDALEAVDPRLVVYYCADEFAALSSTPRSIVATERALLRRADVVFASSALLLRKCLAENPSTYFFPIGVDMAVFDATRAAAPPPPADVAALPRPWLGYMGGLNGKVDLDLVRATAAAFSSGTLVVLGGIEESAQDVALPPNLAVLGERLHRDIPSYLQAFDVCLIPYRVDPFTSNVYPGKLNEYLAMGKPVVATPLPEVVANFSEVVAIAPTHDEFVAAVRTALAEDNPSAVERRVRFARRADWAHVIPGMSAILDEHLRARGG